MSYTYLQERGEESSAECFSDIPASVLSRLNLTAEKFSCKDSGTEFCPSSRSGMMLKPSTENRGEDLSMSCAVDFHVRTLVPPGKAMEFQEKEADSGGRCLESLARFCQVSCSLRTHQTSLFGGGFELLQTLPRWGSILNGELLELMMPEVVSKETECGFIPAPTKSIGKSSGTNKPSFLGGPIRSDETWADTGRQDHWLIGIWKNWTKRENGARCNQKVTSHPTFAAWTMGWPMNWTNLQPLATDKFRSWLLSHGER